MKSFAKFHFVAWLVGKKTGKSAWLPACLWEKNPGWCFAYFLFSGGIRPYFR